MNINSRRIAGFIVLIIGVTLTALLLKSLLHDIPVWFFGRKVTATLEEKWWEDVNEVDQAGGVRNLNYFFRYQFSLPNGKTFVGSSKVTEDEFLSYIPGSEVVIKYFPLIPSINNVDETRIVPFLLCTYIPFILICLFALAAGKELIDL